MIKQVTKKPSTVRDPVQKIKGSSDKELSKEDLIETAKSFE
jgi:hypothetical protein